MVKSGLEKFVHINIPPMRKMVIFVTVILHKTPPFYEVNLFNRKKEFCGKSQIQ